MMTVLLAVVIARVEPGVAEGAASLSIQSLGGLAFQVD